MSWNPTPGQDPNQQPQNPSQYGGYPPQNPNPGQYGGYPPQNPQAPQNPPSDPYSGGQPGYGQPQSGYQQSGAGGYGQQQYGGYQQPYGATAASGAGTSGPATVGLEPNIAAFLSYLTGGVAGLIFFIMEKKNRFIRFHGMQAMLAAAVVIVVNTVLRIIIGYVPVLDFIAACFISPIVNIFFLVVWIILMVNAFQGKYFKLPIIGDYAERYAAPPPGTM